MIDREGPLSQPHTLPCPSRVPLAPESIRQSQRLEAIGPFAGGVAHELSTALQCVSNNLEFLSEAFDDLSSVALTTIGPERARRTAKAPVPTSEVDYLVGEVPKSIEGALRALEQATRIVAALRDVSVPAVSRAPPAAHPIPFDVNRSLRSAVAIAEPRVRHIAQVDARLTDVPPIIWRGTDLNQVFLHLLLNAAQAIESASQTGLGSIHVWSTLEDTEVQVGFADDGCGIAREIQDRIFEPFFTTRPAGKGTGQGLALAQAVVQGQGGRIAVHSTEGCGTTVVLHLPRRPPNVPDPDTLSGGPR